VHPLLSAVNCLFKDNEFAEVFFFELTNENLWSIFKAVYACRLGAKVMNEAGGTAWLYLLYLVLGVNGHLLP